MLFFHRYGVSTQTCTILKTFFQTDFIFFLVSIFLTALLTLPSLLHYIFTAMKYIEIEFGSEIILIPDADVSNEVAIATSKKINSFSDISHD